MTGNQFFELKKILYSTLNCLLCVTILRKCLFPFPFYVKVMKSFPSLSSTDDSGILFHFSTLIPMAKISLWVYNDCMHKMSSQWVQSMKIKPAWVTHGSQVTVFFLKAPLLGGLSFALTFRTE